MSVQWTLFTPVRAAWNDGLRANCVQMRNEGVRVIGRVRGNAAGLEFAQ